MQRRKPNQSLELEYKRQGSKCFYCQDPTPYEFITKDHIIPKVKGGKLNPENKVFACQKCNPNKGSSTLSNYRNRTIVSIIKILKSVIDQNWKISDEQLNDIRYHSKVLKTLTKLVNKKDKTNIEKS